MADPNASEIVATTLQNRSKVLADNVSRNNALLTRLKKRGKVKTFSGGRTIVRELEYANNQTFQWYSGYQTLNIAPSTVISYAEFAIRQAALAISISGLEMIQNSGENALIDLLESRIENGEKTFTNGLAQAVYGDGTATGTINGTAALIATSPSSGTVGGIDRGTWTFWRNIAYSAVTNGGAAASVANIQTYMLAVWRQLVRGTDQVDLIVADNNYWSLYHQSLTAIQRITGSPDMAAAGFSSLKYMNADVVLDGGFQGFSADPISVGGLNGSTGNMMLFMNTDYIYWQPHADRNVVPLDPKRFSINQDAMVQILAWAGNLTMSCAFLQGVLSA